MSIDHQCFEPALREPDVSFVFDHRPSAPAIARRAVEPILGDDPMWSHDVKLATSEMVSNVVVHTGDGGRLDAWADDPVVISVTDRDPNPPVRRLPTIGQGGLGLEIVEQVADEWGVEPTPSGKVVWARFSRPKRSES